MKSLDLIDIESEVIGGVDTHQDLHIAAVVTPDGTVLGTASCMTVMLVCMMKKERKNQTLYTLNREEGCLDKGVHFHNQPVSACLS